MCPLGLVTVSVELSELGLPTDHWVEINQVLMGADGIAAALCIPMAADNGSLAAPFTLGNWPFIQVAQLLHNLTFHPICGAWEKRTYGAVNREGGPRRSSRKNTNKEKEKQIAGLCVVIWVGGWIRHNLLYSAILLINAALLMFGHRVPVFLFLLTWTAIFETFCTHLYILTKKKSI